MADKCGTCGAPIRWVKTEAGKAMPLDAEPCAEGNLVVDGGRARLSETLFDAGQPRYRSHFATCPQAAQHRRPR